MYAAGGTPCVAAPSTTRALPGNSCFAGDPSRATELQVNALGILRSAVGDLRPRRPSPTGRGLELRSGRREADRIQCARRQHGWGGQA
ncbi:hypothetical protein [Streptomyces sp. NPDC001604]|uniref:hypothetical protein n=1 Tax=Streptomyces sp. NPDC001604 TaxID=3364593 RepID=UPI00367A7465